MEHRRTVISLMLAVPDAPAAAEWYRRALGATELWNFGPVIGLEVEGAPFFLAQPANNGWNSPAALRWFWGADHSRACWGSAGAAYATRRCGVSRGSPPEARDRRQASSTPLTSRVRSTG